VKGLRFPIAFKMVTIVIGLMLAATIPIALNLSSEFEEKLRDRLEAANIDAAGARAAEVDGLITNYIDRTKVVASLLLKEYPTKSEREDSLNISFRQDRDLVTVEVYAQKGKSFERLHRVVNDLYLKSYNVGKEYIERLRNIKKFPVAAVFCWQRRN
jgi:hypothetical protein